ncbi:hypothetical protein OpiT1DRAFT_02339 [Opitutaceae bacterium TAV1]|nr:hypothetical protein OpiT1DRAFT_02339 [Opitutaceae bacterium TAV1]
MTAQSFAFSATSVPSFSPAAPGIRLPALVVAFLVALSGVVFSPAARASAPAVASGFAEYPDPDSRWIGNPDAPVSPDNPYLALARRNAAFAARDAKPEIFWLVWGALADESELRGDSALLAKARKATDDLAARLAAKPNGHWDITILLECIRLWKKHAAADSATRARWLAAARASVEHNYTANRKGIDRAPDADWITVAPNALLQSAAVLALAGELYPEERYTDLARALVRAAATHQLPGGAFSYIRDSGPSSLYFGFDATFLGRYYQLTRDPEARRILVAMAPYTHDALANGLFESASATWWKHHWSTGGPVHGAEIVAGLSGDPVARALAEVRLSAAQRYWFSYVAMYFWRADIDISAVRPGADACRLSGNINGPLLRRGDWQVVMPQMPYGDTAVGATLTRPGLDLGFANYLEAAALPVFLKDSGSYRGRGVSIYMIPPDEAARHAGLVNEQEGWIAAGSAFHPRRAVFGEPDVPPAEGWELAQVWFADAGGLAGWLEVAPDNSALAKPAPQHTPRGVLVFGQPLTQTATAHRYETAGLTLTLSGDRIAGTRARGKNNTEAWIDFTFPTSSPAAAGYGATLTRAGHSAATIIRERGPAGILAARVTREGAPVMLIHYNTATNELRVAPAP